MPRRKFFIGVVILLLIMAALWFGASVSKDKPETAMKSKPIPPKLLFSDDFNGESLDTGKWSTCYDWYDQAYDGCTNGGNHELEWYRSSQVSVSNGVARLTAIKQDVMGTSAGPASKPGLVKSYPYVSGMLSTGGRQPGTAKWTGGYGYYEMRAQLPGGDGIWPAFWLLPANGEWPPEIDILELIGSHPDQVQMTYFWNNGRYPPPKDTTTYTGTDFTKGWHTYAIDWQPKEITWYIDGTARKTVRSQHVPNTQMQIIANLAVGGTLPGNPTYETVFPKTMKIDYIHVYESKP